jgi:acetyl-CoA acetyltransferase
LAAHLLKTLVQRNGVLPDKVDEVIFGRAIQGESDANVAMKAAVCAGLPVTVCG